MEAISSEDDLCGSYESAGRRRRGSYGTSCIGAGRSALAWQCIRNRQMADFFLLPFLVAAKQEHINGFNIRNEKGFRLILDKPMVLHADGEYCADVTRVEFGVWRRNCGCCMSRKGIKVRPETI